MLLFKISELNLTYSLSKGY